MMPTAEVNQSAPLFLNPAESIIRSDNILFKLRAKLESKKSPKLLASVVYCLALKAQKKILAYLNDDDFFCQVLWDSRIGLPSSPSLAADVAKCAEVFDLSPELKSLLNSLSGWVLFKKEQMPCCCGGKERMVDIDIMMNTILKVENSSLTVKFLVGVKSDDQDHLEKHYKTKRQSKVDSGLIIIFTCENQITASSDGLMPVIESMDFSHDEQLHVPELEKNIWSAVASMAES